MIENNLNYKFYLEKIKKIQIFKNNFENSNCQLNQLKVIKKISFI